MFKNLVSRITGSKAVEQNESKHTKSIFALASPIKLNSEESMPQKKNIFAFNVHFSEQCVSKQKYSTIGYSFFISSKLIPSTIMFLFIWFFKRKSFILLPYSLKRHPAINLRSLCIIERSILTASVREFKIVDIAIDPLSLSSYIIVDRQGGCSNNSSKVCVLGL